MFFFRRLIKQFIITALIGFVIRKAMKHPHPQVQKVGHQANRLLGGIFGLDERGYRVPSRKRRAAKSASTALVGSAVSYFFDPIQGRQRRQRAKDFAATRLNRNGHTPTSLPAGRSETGPAATIPHTAAGTV